MFSKKRDVFQSKGGSQSKTFDALEWLAAMCSHVPNKGEQMARYYGYHSNVARGKRKKDGADDKIPCILEPELSDKDFRRNCRIGKVCIIDIIPLIGYENRAGTLPVLAVEMGCGHTICWDSRCNSTQS
jgi:hypothetical protein